MCPRYLLRVSLLSLCLSQSLERFVFSTRCAASAARCFNKLCLPSSQRGLNQGATMAAESHPHPYNTPLSKEATINWCTAHSALAITLLSLVSCTAWFKGNQAEVLLVLKAEQYPDNVWPRLAKVCNIYHRRERESFNARETVTSQYKNGLGGGSKDNTRLRSGEINSSC